MQNDIKQYDVVIVGGGLVGTALAAALAKSPLSILLLEQNTVAAVAANIIDLRTPVCLEAQPPSFNRLAYGKRSSRWLQRSKNSISQSRVVTAVRVSMRANLRCRLLAIWRLTSI